MSPRQRVAAGAALGTFGALGMAIAVILGFGDLAARWQGPLAFVFGVAAGAGSVLTLVGLRELKK